MKMPDHPDLLCFWDFREGSLRSSGRYAYELKGDGVQILQEGPVSGYSVRLEEGQYLSVPRADCPGLNIHGKKAQITVLAWVKRDRKTIIPGECEAIAGMWLESEKKRQYCLFLNLWIHESSDQVAGHISGVGGPTPGEKWCMDASIGQNKVPHEDWAFVGFTYDGYQICSFLDGKPDYRPGRNPYIYEEGIFDAGENGADFTVGGVHRLGEMGNFFCGQIGGLAVFDRALSEHEIANIKQLSNEKIGA